MQSKFLPLLMALAFTACQPENPPQQATPTPPPMASEAASSLTPENTAQQGYLQPTTELDYSDDSDKEYIQNQTLLVNKFYPIGWGKNGEFAYVVEPADEACGCYFFDIYIQDKSGENLWSWHYDSSDEEEPLQANLANTWAKNQDLFTEKLKEYGIVEQTAWTISPLEFDDNGKHLAVSSKIQEGKHELFGFDAVKQADFFLKINNEEKKLFTKKYDQYAAVLSEKLVGILRHPTDKRAVIIAKTNNNGYEGPPTVLSLYLVGFEWD